MTRVYLYRTCECGRRTICANFMVCNGCSKTICNNCWHNTCSFCGENRTVNALKKIADELHETPEEYRDGQWLYEYQMCRKFKIDIPGIPDNYELPEDS